MHELFDKIKQKYDLEIHRIVQLNKKYIKPETAPQEEFEPPEPLKVVMPKIPRQPFFRYFTNTNINLEGTEDPILRFVPFIDTEEEYTSITNFEDTLLNEEPLTKEQAIKEKFLRDEVYKQFSELSLYTLRNKLHKDSTYLSKQLYKKENLQETISKLEYISSKLNISISKILELWMQDFDQRVRPLFSNRNALNHYFCNVCLIFDCNIHQWKTQSVPKIEKQMNSLPCSPECYIKNNASGHSFIGFKLFDKKAANLCRRVVSHLSPSPCELKKMLDFYFDDTSNEKQIGSPQKPRFSDVFTCRDAEYIISQLPSNMVPYRKHPYKFAPDTFSKGNVYELFNPCSHSGSCFKNKNCRCWKSKTFCEPACQCEKCDLVFQGCACQNQNEDAIVAKKGLNKEGTSMLHLKIDESKNSRISKQKTKKRKKDKSKNLKVKKPNMPESRRTSTSQCGPECICFLNNRECTDLCQCKSIKPVKNKNTEEISTNTDTRVVKYLMKTNKSFTISHNSSNERFYLKFLCKNQAMTRLNEAGTYVAPSNIEGYGLFAEYDIKKSSFVIAYMGELVTNDEAERRGLFYEKRKLSYLFDLSRQGKIQIHTVDATKIGNKSRFINHSTTPNLQARITQIDGNQQIGFYALRNIKQDEELFFDYCYKEEQKKLYEINDNH